MERAEEAVDARLTQVQHSLRDLLSQMKGPLSETAPPPPPPDIAMNFGVPPNTDSCSPRSAASPASCKSSPNRVRRLGACSPSSGYSSKSSPKVGVATPPKSGEEGFGTYPEEAKGSPRCRGRGQRRRSGMGRLTAGSLQSCSPTRTQLAYASLAGGATKITAPPSLRREGNSSRSGRTPRRRLMSLTDEAGWRQRGEDTGVDVAAGTQTAPVSLGTTEEDGEASGGIYHRVLSESSRRPPPAHRKTPHPASERLARKLNLGARPPPSISAPPLEAARASLSAREPASGFPGVVHSGAPRGARPNSSQRSTSHRSGLPPPASLPIYPDPATATCGVSQGPRARGDRSRERASDLSPESQKKRSASQGVGSGRRQVTGRGEGHTDLMRASSLDQRAASSHGTSGREAHLCVGLLDGSGSVFEHMAHVLRDHYGWRLVSLRREGEDVNNVALSYSSKPRNTRTGTRCNLVLGTKYAAADWVENWQRCPRESFPPAPFLSSGTSFMNYLVGAHCITLKTQLVKTLRRSLGSRKAYQLTPPTFILTPSHARKSNGAAITDERKEFSKATEGGGMWIVKPSHGSKGDNISVAGSYEEAVAVVDGATDPFPWVAQKYIERPFLIGGRKFDIRVWVLVTSKFSIYSYREGVLRTSSVRYDPNDLTNTLSHLTNHCLQERGPLFNAFEEGNEMWFPQFQEYLNGNWRAQKKSREGSAGKRLYSRDKDRSQNNETSQNLEEDDPSFGCKRNFYQDVMPQIDQLTVTTILAARPLIQLPNNSRTTRKQGGGATMECFQLFGFDFMVDSDFRTWLIEVNGSPASAQKLLPGMVKEMLQIVVEPHHPGCLSQTEPGLAGQGNISKPVFELIYSDDPNKRRQGQAA